MGVKGGGLRSGIRRNDYRAFFSQASREIILKNRLVCLLLFKGDIVDWIE